MRLPPAVRTLALSVALALPVVTLFAQDAPAARHPTPLPGRPGRPAWARGFAEIPRAASLQPDLADLPRLQGTVRPARRHVRAARRAPVRQAQSTVEELERSFDRDALDDEARLSWDLWKLQCENARDAMRFRDNVYVFNQMQGAQLFVSEFLIDSHHVDEQSDHLAYLKRIEALPRASGQILERARITTS